MSIPYLTARSVQFGKADKNRHEFMSKPCSCSTSPWRPSGRQSRHQPNQTAFGCHGEGRGSQSLKGLFPTFSSSPSSFFDPLSRPILFKDSSALRERIRTYLDLTYITSQTVRALDLGVSQLEKIPLLSSSTLFPPGLSTSKSHSVAGAKSDGSLILKIGLAHYIASEGGETFFLGTALSHLHLPPAFGRSFMKCIQRKIV